MTAQLDFLDARVEASLNFLESRFALVKRYSQEPLYQASVEALRTNALGGKHIRSRLVHIGAGPVEGAQKQAAIIFGGAVDLLHSCFLVHDDVIDRDPLRRGIPTIHAQITEESGDSHIGNSVGILAGDLGLIAVFQALASSSLTPELSQKASATMAGYAAQTTHGELLDVAHLLRSADALNPETVRESNFLKTSMYSFLAPLHLGTIAAGTDTPEMLTALKEISAPLGSAYQAVDDIAGAIAPAERTGKLEGGDLSAGRLTLLTMRLHNMSLAAAIEEVRQEAKHYITQSRAALDNADLPQVMHAGIAMMIDQVENTIDEH